MDSREEWGEEVVGLGELDLGAVLSVDGSDVTNKFQLFPSLLLSRWSLNLILWWFVHSSGFLG